MLGELVRAVSITASRGLPNNTTTSMGELALKHCTGGMVLCRNVELAAVGNQWRSKASSGCLQYKLEML
jgi:hypothetical protein